MAQTQECVGEAVAFVNQYIALLDEGWEPDLEEFLRRVPEPLQEDVFEQIDAAAANRGVEHQDELQPKAEVVLAHVAPALTWLSRVAPKDIRHQWLGEAVVTRREARECGLPRFEVDLLTAEQVLTGLAQRAPLQMGRPEPDNGAADRAVLAWRFSGPALLAGHVFSSGWMSAAGVALFILAWAAVVWFARTEPMPKSRARAFNAVVGGSVTALCLLILPGLSSGVLALGGLVFGHPGMAAFAIQAFVSVTMIVVCFITVYGWAPEPWEPKRLVRI